MPRQSPPGKSLPKESLPGEVWVLVSAAFVIALGYGIVAPVLPLYAREFNVSYTAVSAIISVFAGVRLVFAPFSGYLVQRFGEKPTYITGVLIVALGTGACALATSYWQLVLLRGIAGVGSTMFSVSAMGLLIRLSPPEMRARISSLYSGGFLIGGVAGPIVGALAAGLGLRAPFVIYAITLLIASAVVATTLRGAHLEEKGAEDLRPKVLLRDAWRRPPYRAAIIANLANGWASFGVRVSLVPLFMAAVFLGSHGAAALALTCYALGNAAIIFPSGRWSDRHGRRPFIISGLFLAGVCTLLFGFAGNIFLALGLCLLAGVGTGLATPSQQAVVADVIGQRARGGQVLALFQMVSDLGAVLGPILIGLLADSAGFAPAFAVTGGFLLLAGLVWVLTPDVKKAPAAEPAPL